MCLNTSFISVIAHDSKAGGTKIILDMMYIANIDNDLEPFVIKVMEGYCLPQSQVIAWY